MICDNIKRIREEINNACIKAGRSPSEVELVAVTKTVSQNRIKEAVECGITHVGENRVQEYLEKYDFFKENKLKTSIIGHLQTNKVKYISDKADIIQSVDSVKLAEEISKQWGKIGKCADILLEINAGAEESKFGVSFDEVFELAHRISELRNIRVMGIMSIPPIFTDEATQRRYFSKLYKIFVDIGSKKIDNIYMNTLSMGMSKDYPYAVMEGSTMVRIGTGIFGLR